MVRGGHHGPAVVPTGRGAVVLPGTLRFACLPWFAGCLSLGYLLWALWSCFLPLMLRLDIKSHIPHKAWPETLKSARKLNKAKTERNRRNCG